MFGSLYEQILYYLSAFLFLLGILNLILPAKIKNDKNFMTIRNTNNSSEAFLIGSALERALVPFALRDPQTGKSLDFRTLESQNLQPVQFEIDRSFSLEAEKALKNVFG